VACDRGSIFSNGASLLFHAGNRRLLDSIDKLLHGFLQEVDLPHLRMLIFLNSGFDCVQSCLVEFLRFDQHLDPLILLSLQVFHDCLVVDEVPLILREVLSADILNLLQLFIVLFINSIIVCVNLFSGYLDKIFQIVNLHLLRV